MFGEVNIEVQDGNLGRNTSTGSFVQVKIGASTSTSTVPVLVTNTMKPEEIKEKLRAFIQEKFEIDDDPDFTDDVHLFNEGFVDRERIEKIICNPGQSRC